jgi:hypothetical protein
VSRRLQNARNDLGETCTFREAVSRHLLQLTGRDCFLFPGGRTSSHRLLRDTVGLSFGSVTRLVDLQIDRRLYGDAIKVVAWIPGGTETISRRKCASLILVGQTRRQIETCRVSGCLAGR